MHYDIQPLVGQLFGIRIRVFSLMSMVVGLFASILLVSWTRVPYVVLGPACLTTSWLIARLTLIPLPLTALVTPLWGKRGWYA